MVKRAARRPAKSAATGTAENPDAAGQPVRSRRVAEVAEPEGLSANFFDGASRDQRVRLYRLDEETKRQVYHGHLSAEEATEDHVAALFGGGRYRAQLMERSEQGPEVVRKSLDFFIPGLYIPPVGRLPGAVRPTDPAAGNSTPTIRLAGSSQSMDPNAMLNSVLVNQVLETVKAGKEVRATTDWTPLLTLLGTVLPPLLTAMFKRDDRSDLLPLVEDLRREVAALRDRPGPVTAGIGDTLRAIRELTEVRDVLAPGNRDGDGGPDVMTLVDKGLTLLANQQRPAPAPAPRRVQERDTVDPHNPRTQGLPLWQQMLLHYRDKLMDTARRGVDPQFAADIAVQFMDADVLGIVQEFVSRPDRVQATVSVLPELGEFTRWLDAFWKAVESTLRSDEQQDDDEEGQQVIH